MTDINNPNITDSSNFIDSGNDAIIKVIGVGGGGGNAVNYMYNQKIPHVNFVVCNTDNQALETSPVPTKLTLGFEITGGRGAGNQPEIGRQCAEASAEDIKKLFQDQTEMVFITAGMGGGTGTGAAPVVAQLAKDSGMLTIGIVTVPFMFEGPAKILKALDGAAEMKKHVDSLLVINNENLVELYKDLDFFNAFAKADDTLANAARSISEIISEKCYINVDFQDVKYVLKDSGTAIIATAEGEGEHRVSDAIHNALHSPLLKTHDIKTSKRLLLKFSCSRSSAKPLQAQEINEITEFTSQLPPTIDVKWGIADNPELGEKIKITVLAAGFDVTLVDKEKGGDGGVVVFRNEDNPAPKSVDTVRKERQKEEDQIRIAEMYGHEKMATQMKIANKVKYAVLLPSQFDDMEVISMLERTPAYNRDPRFNSDLKQLAEAKANPAPIAPRPAGGNTISFDDFGE
ncbi:MAG: cell division protein FtsZ [Bacteroides sp.]|nr:cell division protein FtsZ [Bacteroides sp.]MBD5336176.1 cell division protein FtsZ [Bacteroides sp.]